MSPLAHDLFTLAVGGALGWLARYVGVSNEWLKGYRAGYRAARVDEATARQTPPAP